MKLSKVFNIRVGLVVMFTLLIVSYAVLAVIYINSVYQSTQPTTTPSVDVMQFAKSDEGYTIKVPKVIVVGEPFNYHIEGKKLVDNGADVRQQLTCTDDGVSSTYTLGTFYSDQPKGDFSIDRETTIAVTTRLQPSEKCVMQSVGTYTFYRVDRNGNETNFTVREVAESNPFKLEVPRQPATEPKQN